MNEKKNLITPRKESNDVTFKQFLGVLLLFISFFSCILIIDFIIYTLQEKYGFDFVFIKIKQFDIIEGYEITGLVIATIISSVLSFVLLKKPTQNQKKNTRTENPRPLLDKMPTEATIHVQQSDTISNNFANKYISSVENKIKFTGEPLDKTAYNQINSLLANQSEEYNNEILPNNNTIAEQQIIDFNISLGRYPEGTSEYLNMKIIPNTVPANEDYNVLNEHEKIFFQAFSKQLIDAKLNPSSVQLRRLSSGCFNVNYLGYYIGKINLYELPTSYAVIKKGNKRATKIFNNLPEAEEYVSHKENYEIKIRKTPTRHYMQYLRGFSTIKELENPSLEQCIEYIPYFIRYIKYCKKH